MRRTLQLCAGITMFGLVIPVGIIVGVLGSVVGTYQDWKWVIKTDIRQWKRYPKLSNIKWWDANNRVSDSRKSYEKEAITKKAKGGAIQEPGPVQKVLIWSLWYGFFLPGRCLAAFIMGPIVAFEKAVFFWKTHVEEIPSTQLIKHDINSILGGN